MRDQLINYYLDYVNNYLTVDLFAEHHGLSKDHALILLGLCKDVFDSNHPEA